MNRPRMTAAASALYRALVTRAGQQRDRILLSEWITTDWQSLTFVGERHHAGFIIRGDDASALVEQWTYGLEEAELDIGPSAFVAEIALTHSPRMREDGAIQLEIEALTIAD